MRSRWPLPLLLAGAFVLLAATETASRADAIADTEVEAAERAYAALDYPAAIHHADQAIAHGALAHAALVRAYRVSAVAHAALEQTGPAKEAFRKLLTIDPEYELDRALSPKVQTPYFEARGDWRAESVHPGLEALALLAPGEPGTLRVTTRGFSGLVKYVSVSFRWGAVREATTKTVPPETQIDVPVPPPPPGGSRFDYWVQAMDDRDDVLFEVGNPATPKTTFLTVSQPGASTAVDSKRGASDAPAHQGGGLLSSPVFWTVAAVVVVGAGVGTYFLAKGSPSPTLGPRLACGNSASDSCN